MAITLSALFCTSGAARQFVYRSTFVANHAPPSSTHHLHQMKCRCARLKSTKEGDMGDDTKGKIGISKHFQLAAKKFKARPTAYLLIPVIAAFVGWFTNYLAVQMIFYPIEFRGIPIWRKEGEPLGLLGWQGIVPAKTFKMSETMVNMVTTQLLNVEEVFRRLDPNIVASTLGPEVPKLMETIGNDIVPLTGAEKVARLSFFSLPGRTKAAMSAANHKFLHDFTISMQDNIGSLLNIKNCVIDQMMQDRSLLGQLFRKCGQVELDFLTNSGLWFVRINIRNNIVAAASKCQLLTLTLIISFSIPCCRALCWVSYRWLWHYFGRIHGH